MVNTHSFRIRCKTNVGLPDICLKCHHANNAPDQSPTASHMNLGCDDGDISAIGPNLGRLLAVNAEGENIVARRQYWHLDKINEIEVETASPELILLFIALLTWQTAGATGLTIAVKPSLGNTRQTLCVHRRREHWPLFATLMHL